MMSPSTSPPTRFPAWFMLAIVWVVAFDLAFAWQRSMGAHGSEFGGHREEAAHYITGLMVRDYIAGGFPDKPAAFAENYAAHYPKVAWAVSPPLFDIAQALWALPFGIGRTAVMLLLCAIAATLATLLYRELQREFPLVIAACGVLVFISLPLVREYYSLVMPDLLGATLIFAAVACFSRFVE